MFVVHTVRNLSMIDRRINISVVDPNQFSMKFNDPIVFGLVKYMADQLENSND